MKRLLACAALCLLLLGPFSAAADDPYGEQWQASGIEAVMDQLPEETRRLLDRLGITGLAAGELPAADPAATAQTLWEWLLASLRTPLTTAAVLLGVCLLAGWLRGLRHTVASDATADTFDLLCGAVLCTCLLTPLCGCIRQAYQALVSVSVFMMSFLPVFAGILLTGGQSLTAASYQTALLLAAQGIAVLAGTVLLPLMSVSLVCAAVGALSPQTQLHRVGEGLNKAVAWVVGICTAVFTGILSVKSLLGQAADSVSTRAMRFSISSLVPVVGSSLGEAFAAIRSSLRLLRTAVGCFGMCATAGIVLPVLLSCVSWSAVLGACGWAADVLHAPTLGTLLRSGRSVTRTLIALLCACALLMIVSTAVVVAAGSQL